MVIQLVNPLKRITVKISSIEIFKTSKKFSCSIVYPEDVAVGKNLADASKN